MKKVKSDIYQILMIFIVTDCLADLVLLDEALNIKATYISGEEVWRKEP